MPPHTDCGLHGEIEWPHHCLLYIESITRFREKPLLTLKRQRRRHYLHLGRGNQWRSVYASSMYRSSRPIVGNECKTSEWVSNTRWYAGNLPKFHFGALLVGKGESINHILFPARAPSLYATISFFSRTYSTTNINYSVHSSPDYLQSMKTPWRSWWLVCCVERVTLKTIRRWSKKGWLGKNLTN